MNISAIIPVYNGKKYLHEAIDSVINQTLKPIELILVDDGSTDNSVESISSLKAPFPIHVIKQKNAGQSAARNRGITAARGDFIALLDQDDYWYKNHLERLAQEFEKNDHLGWSYSNVDESDHKGRRLKTGLLNYVNVSHPKQDVVKMLGEDLHILPSAALIRKKALQEVGLFDERFSGYEDDDIFLRLFIAGWNNTYVETPLSIWRIHSESSGHTLRMHASRRLFAEKAMDLFKDIEMSRFSVSDIIGTRFFDLYIKLYKRSMLSGNYEMCLFCLDELQYYHSMKNRQNQKKWKNKLVFLKYPRFIHRIYKLKNLRIFG